MDSSIHFGKQRRANALALGYTIESRRLLGSWTICGTVCRTGPVGPSRGIHRFPFERNGGVKSPVVDVVLDFHETGVGELNVVSVVVYSVGESECFIACYMGLGICKCYTVTCLI